MKVPSKVTIQKFFDSDRAILMACIFIALIFWVLVKLSQTFNTTVDFQIKYKLPVGKSFVLSPPTSAKATLKGTGWDLISYQFQKEVSSILFELNDVSSQAINGGLIIDKFQQTIPPDIEVSDVNMDFIFVQIENESKIKVPIKLIQNITLASQTQLADSIKIVPDSVTLTGPSSEVQSLKYWETEMLEIIDLSKNETIEVSLKEPINKEIYLSDDKIKVSIEVEQFTQKSFFLPITIKNAPDSLKTFPERAKLSCLVGLSKFNEINRSSFELVADLQGIPLNTEKNTIPVLLTKQPDFVRGVNFQPRSVEFFFVETEKMSKEKEK
jgi:YbbR domain-containing protein